MYFSRLSTIYFIWENLCCRCYPGEKNWVCYGIILPYSRMKVRTEGSFLSIFPTEDANFRYLFPFFTRCKWAETWLSREKSYGSVTWTSVHEQRNTCCLYCRRFHNVIQWNLSYFKRTPTGPSLMSALWRCPFNTGSFNTGSFYRNYKGEKNGGVC